MHHFLISATPSVPTEWGKAMPPHLLALLKCPSVPWCTAKSTYIHMYVLEGGVRVCRGYGGVRVCRGYGGVRVCRGYGSVRVYKGYRCVRVYKGYRWCEGVQGVYIGL